MSEQKIKILIINGPNLNMLGIREPEVYGKETFAELCEFAANACREVGAEYELFQSNHEGDIVDKIQEAYGKFDGIVINPAAYTHTSVAIPDAIKAVSLPAVEVHLSDITKREDFRRHSFVSPACIRTIYGKGFEGYREAVQELAAFFEKKAAAGSARGQVGDILL